MPATTVIIYTDKNNRNCANNTTVSHKMPIDRIVWLSKSKTKKKMRENHPNRTSKWFGRMLSKMESISHELTDRPTEHIFCKWTLVWQFDVMQQTIRKWKEQAHNVPLGAYENVCLSSQIVPPQNKRSMTFMYKWKKKKFVFFLSLLMWVNQKSQWIKLWTPDASRPNT